MSDWSAFLIVNSLLVYSAVFLYRKGTGRLLSLRAAYFQIVVILALTGLCSAIWRMF